MSVLQAIKHLENLLLSIRRNAFTDIQRVKLLKNFASFFFHQSPVDLGVHHQRVGYFKTVKGTPSTLCNDKLSPGRHFVIEWWRYLRHGYVPGTGSHDHRPILPPRGKSCPVRGGFRLVWSSCRLDLVFYCYRLCELHFFLEITTQIAFKNGDGDKDKFSFQFFVKSVAHELNIPINR